MKVFYITTTACIVVAVRFIKPWKDTYQAKFDYVPRVYMILPALVLALIPGLHDRFTFLEITWSFSIYLEAFAAIPQLAMLRKCGEIEMYMLVYLMMLASYRMLYVANWLYRAHVVSLYKISWPPFFAAVMQTLPFAYFFITVPKIKRGRAQS